YSALITPQVMTGLLVVHLKVPGSSTPQQNASKPSTINHYTVFHEVNSASDLLIFLSPYFCLHSVQQQLLPQYSTRMNFATSIFHSYVHNWKCQLAYNPRLNEGWGLTDGEVLEHLWSYLSPPVSPLKYATRKHRLSAINHWIIFFTMPKELSK
ncbi:hypothetical protein VP01_4554g1, partial [Puccinia sorghi]